MKVKRGRRRRQRSIRGRVKRHADQAMLWPETMAPVFRNRRVRVELENRQPVTADGGLAAAHLLVMRLGLDRAINRRLCLLKFPLPYWESDHVLTHVYNLYVGGRDLEDIQSLQHSVAVKNLLGACRVPDPTTAGDFLRRFEGDALGALQAAIDEGRAKVWRRMPRAHRRCATVDIDSTVKPVYGECKEGAEFSYLKSWSYHPLLVTLAETSECLRLVNRPGNVSSAAGAAEVLDQCLPMLTRHFGQVTVRGDSKFSERAILRAVLSHGARVAVVYEMRPNVRAIADGLPEGAWGRFDAHRGKRRRSRSGERRRTRRRYRREIVKRRGYRTLSTVTEWVAEVRYTPTGFDQLFRLVFKRQLIEEREQGKLFEHYEYRAVLTNIPRTEMSSSQVTRFAYGRCNQENAIEQAKNGLGAMRMPTGTLLANAAFMLAAELAWCVRAWLSLLAFPRETRTWEWDWFRRAFVHAPAHIVGHARSATVRFTASHRFSGHIVTACQRLAAMEFG